MSQTTRNATGNQLTIDTDVSKIFVWDNRFENGNFNNDGYDDLSLKAGTLLGRVAATGKLKVLTSAAVDGSQFPVGILNEDHDILAGDNKDVAFCVAGDVVESKVILDGADTLTTVIDDRTIKDRIGADTVGVKLVVSEELSKFDN